MINDMFQMEIRESWRLRGGFRRELFESFRE